MLSITRKPKGETAELSPSDRYLIEYSGEYKVRYLYEDALYSGSKDLTFTAVPSSKPIFDSPIMNLNGYYIKGYTYSIEVNKAYNYSENGATPANVEAYVKFDNGDFEKIEDVGNIVISANDSLRFKLQCENSGRQVGYYEILCRRRNVGGNGQKRYDFPSRKKRNDKLHKSVAV